MEQHDAHSTGGKVPSADVDAAATCGHSAADAAAAPKPRGRKRTCEHGAPDEPRPKAATCRKCAAERKALSRLRGNCEAKPKLLAVPSPRDGLSIADEHRSERKLLALWTKHYVAMWKSIGARSASVECVRVQLERARSARALELRETPKRCIAPLWKAMPGLVATPYLLKTEVGERASAKNATGSELSPRSSLVLADPFCGALAVFKSWHEAVKNATRACVRPNASARRAFREGDRPRAGPETDASVASGERVAKSRATFLREVETGDAGSSSAFAGRRRLASWRCGDRVSWTRRASFHRRRGLLTASGGAFARKDALDPYETPLGDEKKNVSSSLPEDEDDVAAASTAHRRLGFVFEPPARAADAAFARFVAYRARFCAVLLPSDWLDDADAPWRAEAWARLAERGACAVVPTPAPVSLRDGASDDASDDASARDVPRAALVIGRDNAAATEAERVGASERGERIARHRSGAGATTCETNEAVSGAKRAYAWHVVFRDARTREDECPDETFWET